ncbi:phage tail sheath family protein [Planotetraspora mira]|uniref:Tail protein n=1 Tax=Planotetraspora mira TaxID=58121 RepID=A0A8J3TLT8_9ACTN|nr:phage tail sheath family protein [Planotetraspora mira]GII28151.1 tail protein [Planotetraspora mira]
MPTYLTPGVYVEEVEAGSRPIEGVGTAVAAFVGFAALGPYNTATLVTSWSQFTQTFGDFIPGCNLAHAVYGYFLNGGGTCYVVRIGGDGAGTLPEPQAMLGTYRVAAKELENGKPEIVVEVAQPAGQEEAGDRFNLVVKRDGKVEETYEGVTAKRGKDNVATQVQSKSRLITLVDTGTTAAVPSPQSVTLRTPPAPAAVPDHISADDYVGNVAERTGFGGLEAVDEITMVAVPDLMGAYERGAIDLEGVKVVQDAIIAHCELMGDRMAILDAPPGMTAHQVKEWRTDLAGYDSKYATLYYPWVKIFDPAVNATRFLPPSGHVAGIWARSDATRGVHKAPANEVVRGAVALQTQLTKGEQELLNPIGINCIRAFSGRGIRIWGARTLSSDPAWRYLNVRRLFNYLEESILTGTQWVVFEPNDDALWARIRRSISAFLILGYQQGSLFGRTPDEAFYVKCDGETNTAESIEAGQVICEIGVAPVKPAEFVVFRLAQISGGAGLIGE